MKILLAILLSLLTTNAYASCGLPPLPPIPPLGTSSCQAICVCDQYGNNCEWQFACR